MSRRNIKSILTFNNLFTETFISIAILALLFFIALAVIIKQSRYNLSQYGIIRNSKTEINSKKIDPLSIVPQDFKLLSKLQEYDKETLYEKINGKAPLYLNSGYIKLLTQRYVHAKNNKLWMEIYFYDMGSTLNAFSVYSRQKRHDAVDDPGTLYCYKTENAEILVRGNYYIEIIGSEKNPLLRSAIASVSKKIQSQLGPMKPLPGLLLFKSTNLVAGSEKYYTENAFGIKDFKAVFSARYKYRNETTTVFISGPHEDADLNKTIALFRDFWKKQEAVEEQTSTKITNFVLINSDGYYDTIFKTDRYCAGIHEADSKELAIDLSVLFDKVIKSNSGVQQ